MFGALKMKLYIADLNTVNADDIGKISPERAEKAKIFFRLFFCCPFFYPYPLLYLEHGLQN